MQRVTSGGIVRAPHPAEHVGGGFVGADAGQDGVEEQRGAGPGGDEGIFGRRPQPQRHADGQRGEALGADGGQGGREPGADQFAGHFLALPFAPRRGVGRQAAKQVHGPRRSRIQAPEPGHPIAERADLVGARRRLGQQVADVGDVRRRELGQGA